MRIIAGPCQHETKEQSLAIAKECKRVCDKHGIEYIFKASYDKANRSNIHGIRGRGLADTMQDFKSLKQIIPSLKIITDVHNINEILKIGAYYDDIIDVLQIPAFLCRQTDLVRAACKTNKIVNIKKGQFVAPWDTTNIVNKADYGDKLWITERGTCFGYNNIIVDYTGIQYMLDNVSAELVFDVTHSVQKPGGRGSSSGGNSDYVLGLARSGSAVGVENFFLEVHPDPANAPSDGDCMLNLELFERCANEINRYHYTR